MREKLIELVGQVQDCGCDVTDVVEMNYVENITLVDHLIANGVTIQPLTGCKQPVTDNNVGSKWIPVTERLPEVGRSVIAYNALAKCAAEAVYKGEGKFLQFRWAARLQEREVTHWMPLPEPPTTCHMTSKQTPKGE